VCALFDAPDAIIAAAREVRPLGRLDAFTPFPIRELNDLISQPDPSIPWATFLGGLAGAVSGFWLGWYINFVEFPLNVGGRPLFSWPAFVLPAFELAVLFSTLAAMGTMLFRNRLPRLHHPDFDLPGFERVTDDGFLLVVETEDSDAARRLLRQHGGATA
ncbi:MAG TPA: DUF3341 domain-containing protein, partial [Magnetospirillum sp.]|nr:DUF3341 domain-containing protein [Magnetospirillum sp.]